MIKINVITHIQSAAYLHLLHNDDDDDNDSDGDDDDDNNKDQKKKDKIKIYFSFLFFICTHSFPEVWWSQVFKIFEFHLLSKEIIPGQC